MSGYAYADGWAYGSVAVGQPENDAVSYWYQSTASTTGDRKSTRLNSSHI